MVLSKEKTQKPKPEVRCAMTQFAHKHGEGRYRTSFQNIELWVGRLAPSPIGHRAVVLVSLPLYGLLPRGFS